MGPSRRSVRDLLIDFHPSMLRGMRTHHHRRHQACLVSRSWPRNSGRRIVGSKDAPRQIEPLSYRDYHIMLEPCDLSSRPYEARWQASFARAWWGWACQSICRGSQRSAPLTRTLTFPQPRPPCEVCEICEITLHNPGPIEEGLSSNVICSA